VNHDNGNTNLSGLVGPRRPVVRRKWPYPDSPTIGVDGTLYINTGAALVALEADGTKKWEHQNQSRRIDVEAPTVGRRSIYGVSATGTLIALTPTGTTRWRFDMKSTPAGPLSIAADNTIYCADELGRLFAIRHDGRQKWVFAAPHGAEWRRATGVSRFTTSAAAPNGTLYLTVPGPRFYAVSSDGREQWSLGPDAFGVDGPAGARPPDLMMPMIQSDGTAYVISATSEGPSRLHAIEPSGHVKWSAVDEDATMLAMALGPAGTIYVADDGGLLIALDPSDGGEMWRVRIGQRAWALAGPSVDAKGTIYIGCESGEKDQGIIYAVRPSGKVTWRLKIDAEPAGEIVIGPNRKLYVAATGRAAAEGDYRDHLLVIGQK